MKIESWEHVISYWWGVSMLELFSDILMTCKYIWNSEALLIEWELAQSSGKNGVLG
jgi:hypothetical protein